MFECTKKKENTALDDFNNYRPISNLLFLEKILERIVASQLYNHLIINFTVLRRLWIKSPMICWWLWNNIHSNLSQSKRCFWYRWRFPFHANLSKFHYHVSLDIFLLYLCVLLWLLCHSSGSSYISLKEEQEETEECGTETDTGGSYMSVNQMGSNCRLVDAGIQKNISFDGKPITPTSWTGGFSEILSLRDQLKQTEEKATNAQREVNTVISVFQIWKFFSRICSLHFA